MDQDIFTLVSDVADKDKIFNELCQYQIEIVLKGDSPQLHNAKALVRDPKSNQIKCSLTSAQNPLEGELLLGHFFLNEQKYYFKCSTKIEDGFLLIPFGIELYHLQRRQHFRVRIPEQFPAVFNIIELNGESTSIRATLRDFSSQGTRLLLPQALKSDLIEKKLYGQLVIKDNPPIELRGIIRHIQEVPPLMGVEFSPLSDQLEAKLFSISLELHKQLFKP